MRRSIVFIDDVSFASLSSLVLLLLVEMRGGDDDDEGEEEERGLGNRCCRDRWLIERRLSMSEYL